jgi:hypothetical protein
MDIADFILQLEADLKSEANVTDQETSDQEKTSKKLDSDKSYRAKGKKPKNGSLKDKSEDDLVDLEELEPEDQPDEEQASSEDDDVPMEIDLSKADSWTDTKNAFNRLRAGESLEGHEEIEAYWNRLSRGEKMTFFALISATGQVLTGGLDGKVAKLPSELGIKINKDTTDKEKERSKKLKTKAKASNDDVAPIVVGESQDISSIKNYLKLING